MRIKAETKHRTDGGQ